MTVLTRLFGRDIMRKVSIAMIAQPGFLREVTRLRLGGVPAGRIGLALSAVLLAWIAMRLTAWLLRRVGRRRRGLAASLAVRVARPAGLLVMLFGIYGALRILPLPDGAVDISGKALLITSVLGATWILLAVIDALSDLMASRRSRTGSRFDDQMMPLLRNTAKVILAAVGGVFLLQSLGYPVGGIIAGLGIGGLAVALAAQDTLAGIFASIAIVLDRPFAVGDYIEVAGVQGSVEDIGLRSTRLRTPDRTLVSIPNRKLIELSVDNWSERAARRTLVSLSLERTSDPDQVEALLCRLRSLLETHPSTEKGTYSVHLSGIGESALGLDMIFFLQTREYYEWLSLRSGLCLDVLKAVKDCGLLLAYPTQTVRLEEAPPPLPATGTGSGSASSGQA
jgi:MscS family membrane protein